MNQDGLWQEPLFKEVIVFSLVFFSILWSIFFSLRKKNNKYRSAWASTQSWLISTPFILMLFALASPKPLVLLCFICIFSAKTFYKMVGIYHRSWFLWFTYVGIIGLGFATYFRSDLLFNLAPMIFLMALSIIPLIRNSPTQMIQYISLSLLCFIFFGWSLMHFGKMLMLERGSYLAIYIYILTEFSNSVGAEVRLLVKKRVFKNITKRLTLEGMALSLILTLTLAWGLRHMLIDRSEKYWIVAGITASIGGRLGSLILSVIRRDLGVKNSGIFIIGRDDILARVDKLIFVGPIFYYAYLYLQGQLTL